MSAKVRITTVLILLVLPLALFQGCGGSSDDSNSPTPGQSLNLAMSSSNNITALLADGVSSVQLQMQVNTQSGQAIANTPVTFSTTAGTLSAVAGTNVVNSAHLSSVATRQVVGGEITINTDANGMALVLLTSSHFVESAIVSAKVEGFKQSVRVDFISGFPAQLLLSNSANLVGEGGTATITATVSDADGNPLAGVVVAFELFINVSDGASVSPTSSTTDASGEARTTYQAGTTSGTDTIRATVSTVATSSTAGGNISETTEIDIQPQTLGNLVNNVQLLVSSPQLDSDGVETVTLTALVRDSNNNLLAGVPVTFRTDDTDTIQSAAIQVTRGTTDETGTAEAILSTGGDPTNRTIMLMAQAGGQESKNSVQVSGTTLTFSGNNSLVLDEPLLLTVLVRDSSGVGIANQRVILVSKIGSATINGELTPTEVTTDSNGQSAFNVVLSEAGTHTIEATALGATGTFDITVSASTFTFKAPEPYTEVPLSPVSTDCVLPPQIHEPLEDLSTLQDGQTSGCLNMLIHFATDENSSIDDEIRIEFTTTRGHIDSSSSVLTTVEGYASVAVRADNAGFALITASCPDPDPETEGDACDNTPTTQRIVEFVATEADSMSLEANPASIGVNASSVSNEQSTISAIVRDPANNLVKNKRIDFTLSDITGGTINPASAITDSFGRASTVYTAGSVSSSSNGVAVTAVVNDTPAVTASVNLTVADKALFIKIGTANAIFEEDDVLYRYPYSVIVTDASGNSVPGARVELSATSVRYQKGEYIPVGEQWVKSVAATCLNEDVNNNGILEPGEDFNGNGILDPGEVAAVTEAVVTNENGIGFFDLRYAQEFTWVEVRVTARAIVAGTESLSSATFFLPPAASDVNNKDISPPGQQSPFGTQAGCANTN